MNIDTLLDVVFENATFTKDAKNPIYVVLIHYPSVVSNAVKWYTKDEYSHACIAFDSTLDEMYSFGSQLDGEDKNNPLAAGFTVNSINNPYWQRPGVMYGLYVTFVSDRELKIMKEKLELYRTLRKKYSFNIDGIVKIAMGINPNTKNKMFCSQFVAEILNAHTTKVTTDPASVRPNDYQFNENFYMVTKGIATDYKKDRTEVITEAIRRAMTI